MSTSEKIVVTAAHFECRMCPTTIVGTTSEGWTIYARYRWGHLSVRLDHDNPPEFGGAAGAWIFEKQLDPEGLAGWISYEELKELTSDLVEWPDELTERPHHEGDDTCLDDLLA